MNKEELIFRLQNDIEWEDFEVKKAKNSSLKGAVKSADKIIELMKIHQNITIAKVYRPFAR